VDHVATRRHQDQRFRPATGAGLSQSCDRAIPDRITACFNRLAASDKIPLDLFADRGTIYYQNLGTRISKITLETIGVDVSPHLFRTAAATTAALHGTELPHLASAVLGHSDRLKRERTKTGARLRARFYDEQPLMMNRYRFAAEDIAPDHALPG
jgi:integrase